MRISHVFNDFSGFFGGFREFGRLGRLCTCSLRAIVAAFCQTLKMLASALTPRHRPGEYATMASPWLAARGLQDAAYPSTQSKQSVPRSVPKKPYHYLLASSKSRAWYSVSCLISFFEIPCAVKVSLHSSISSWISFFVNPTKESLNSSISLSGQSRPLEPPQTISPPSESQSCPGFSPPKWFFKGLSKAFKQPFEGLLKAFKRPFKGLPKAFKQLFKGR